VTLPKTLTQDRQSRVLVIGESPNGTKTIAELIQSLCPRLERRVDCLRTPPVHVKDAPLTELPSRSSKALDAIRAAASQHDVQCVFVHEDCDAVEPAHEALSERIEGALNGYGYRVCAVTPAWETEPWLLLWPTALAKYRPT
jgi:hypothetical protein